MKTQEICHTSRPDVFIVNFDQIQQNGVSIAVMNK